MKTFFECQRTNSCAAIDTIQFDNLLWKFEGKLHFLIYGYISCSLSLSLYKLERKIVLVYRSSKIMLSIERKRKMMRNKFNQEGHTRWLIKTYSYFLLLFLFKKSFTTFDYNICTLYRDNANTELHLQAYFIKKFLGISFKQQTHFIV